MSFNLRNRSLLTVQDYTPREFRYLLDLARDLKRAKYARTEQKHPRSRSRTRRAFSAGCTTRSSIAVPVRKVWSN